MEAKQQTVRPFRIDLTVDEAEFVQGILDGAVGGIGDDKDRERCADLARKFDVAIIEHDLRAKIARESSGK